MRAKHCIICLPYEYAALQGRFDDDVLCLLPGGASAGTNFTGVSVTRAAKRFLSEDPRAQAWIDGTIIPRLVTAEAGDSLRAVLGVTDEQ